MATVAAGSTGVSAPESSVRLHLEVPREVPLGQPVPIELRLENPASEHVTIYLRGRDITFDVTIARSDGVVSWRRLEDEIIPAIVQARELGPGEVITLRTTWDQRTRSGSAGAGEYTVRAALLLETDSLSTGIIPLRIR